MLRAVIFDLDGTLLDTQADFALLLERLVIEHGLPAVDPARLAQTVSAGARAMLRLGFQMEEGAAELDPLLQRFLDDYEQQLPTTASRLYEDIDVLIADLVDAGLSWGIMTNKSRRFSEPLVSRFESFATCGSLVCPDDVGLGKPDPAGILRACAELGVNPAEAVYVGDHPRDIEAARNAAMPGIAVRWGYLPENSDPHTWGASFVAADAAELRTHLLELMR